MIVLESSKNVFRESRNPALEEFGGEMLKEADYSRGIPVAKYKESKRLLYIDFKKTTRVMIFGPSGSGKTMLGNAIMSRLYDQDRDIVNLADVKNDFRSWDYKGGCQKEYVKKMGLAKNEQLHSIPKEIYSPRFLLSERDNKPSYVTGFSWGFQDISKSDLRFLVGEGDMSSNVKSLFTEIVSDIDINDTSFEELNSIAEEKKSGDFNHGTVNSLKANIKGLKSSDIISNRYRDNPLDALKKDKVVSLGLEGWRNFQRGELYKLEFYSALMLRRLKSMVSNAELDPGFGLFMAEAHKLCPAGENSLLKREVNDLFTQAQRQMDAPVVMDTQTPSQLPNSDVSGRFNFIGQATHIFLGCDQNGRPLGENEWTKVLKSVNLLNRSNRDDWRERIKQLDTYDFLYINPGMHDGPFECPTVQSLAPLVNHAG